MIRNITGYGEGRAPPMTINMNFYRRQPGRRSWPASLLRIYWIKCWHLAQQAYNACNPSTNTSYSRIAPLSVTIASEFSVGFNDRGVYLTDAAWAIGRVVFSLLKLRNGIMP